MVKNKLFLIDATAFCYRAFYALKELSTSFGQPTNAVYGFVNMLNKIIKEKKPEYIAACFDVSRDTFRAKKFAEYKMQRPPMPDGLSSQIPLIKEVIRAYGIKILEKEGYEADDIIATVTHKAKEQSVAVTIISSDKDMLQLVGDDIVVFNPYKEKGVVYDSQTVKDLFGISARQIPDMLALMGDNADNIPGVPGIGEKTAVELIKTFGSLDGLLGGIDNIKQEKIRQTVRQNLETIKLNKELVSLGANVEMDFNLRDYSIPKPDTKELFRIFQYLEFRKFVKDLPLEAEITPSVSAAAINDNDLKSFTETKDKLFLYGQSFENMVFCIKDKIFKASELGPNIKSILANPEIKKVSHDLKKIKVSFAANNIKLEGIYFDTMIAAHLINPSLNVTNLSDVALEYLGKDALVKEADNVQVVEWIIRLEPKLEEKLSQQQLLGLFRDIEMPLAEVLSEMESTGIKVDLELLKNLEQDIGKKLSKLIKGIYEISGVEFNINSPKQLREILFEKLKLPVIKKTKTGASTDEEVLRSLAKSHELPKLLLEYRKLMKLKTTYVDALPALVDSRTGRIHTSFNQTITETGRLSSSNPNLQNLPVKSDVGAKIRQAVVHSERNSSILACDYSQVELRVLAHFSKDDNLVNAFKNNKDIHKATAALVFNVDEGQVSQEMREMSKRINFGIVYGLSSYGLSKDSNMPLDEAQAFIDAYFMRYPKVKSYIEEQIKIAERDGFVTTILGRRRYIPEINNKNQAIRQFAQRQAVNTPIQGSASDLIKLAMIEIDKQIKQQNLKSRMLIQVHDELVFDVPEEEFIKFSALVKDKMENVLKLDVPIRVDMKKGKNWLEMEEI
ncbi:MAG: DNA polymerase I [Candidatus Omnitrophota bacterium]